jgi:hypothetical protein
VATLPPQADRPQAVYYSVVEIPTGRVLLRGTDREKADGYAFGFNGAAKADGNPVRAGVVVEEDAPPPQPPKKHLVYLWFDGDIQAEVRTTEDFAAEFNRVMPLGWQAEIVRIPRKRKPRMELAAVS